MTDLIVTGSLPLIESAPRTLVADQITAYLERQDKTMDESVLEWMMAAFRRKVVKQLMSVRDTRKGHDSCSMYSGPCARKAWYQGMGTVGEPVQARAVMKWLMGDTVELDVVGVAVLAGVGLVDNNRDLFVTGHDGKKVQVHPDGRVESNGEHYNFECKSMDTYSFDACLANHGPDDRWGYLTQASVEIAAWREAGYAVDSTCFVAVSTGSRQGSIAEWIIPYNQSLVDAWHDRRRLARGATLPPVPFEATPETQYLKGKTVDPDWFTHGEPVPRLDKHGKIHGWDVPTGRSVLPLYCSYCAYKDQCWRGAQIEVQGGKPVWVVPEQKQ